MDQKLLEYRAKKERDQFLKNGKEKLKRLFSLNTKKEVIVEVSVVVLVMIITVRIFLFCRNRLMTKTLMCCRKRAKLKKTNRLVAHTSI